MDMDLSSPFFKAHWALFLSSSNCMTTLIIIRNFRACIKASEIIPSDIPHISKINWTCKDHEGDHRERERENIETICTVNKGMLELGIVWYRSAHN